MFRTIWSKTLRDYRIAILGWGIGLAILVAYGLAGYATAVNTPAARQSLAQLAQSFKYVGEPVAITTPAGYATWKYMGFVPVLLGIWALLAGTRLVRGDEERGSLDVLLSTPQSRATALLQKIGALAVALLLIGCLIAVGALIGEAGAKATVSVGSALLTGLNVSLTAFFFAMLAVVLSQLLASRGAAAGWTGGLMVLAYLLDGTGRVATNLQWVQRISPFFYYDLSKPLIPTYGSNAGALLMLLVGGVALAAISVPLFVRRDMGAPLFALRRREGAVNGSAQGIRALERAEHDGWLHNVGLRAFRAQGATIFWWVVGIAAYSAYLTTIARATEDALRRAVASSPGLKALFQGANIGNDAGFLSFVVFTFLPILTTAFALSLAMGWVSDLDRGRLEVVLGTPQPRWRIVLERFGASLVAIILAPLVTWLAVLICAHFAGLHDAGHLAAATFGVVPLEAITLAFVYLLAGRPRGSIVFSIASGLLILSFFAEFLQSVLNLPDWMIGLSIFHQYGTPIMNGVQWGAWLALTGIAIVFLALGVTQFSRADLERGT